MIALAAAVAAGACDNGRSVAVRVSLPGPDSADAALQGVVVVAVPYDRDSIVAALERRQGTPRPHTATLDSIYRRFREPFTSFAAATARLDAVRDSARRGTASAGRVAAAEAEVARLRPALDEARNDLARADTLRHAIRLWEDSTYEGYDSLAKERSRVRKPIADTTDAAGLANFALGAGDWWVTATAWDAGDPNAIWYWNERIVDDTVRLDRRNAVHRPRY